MRIEIPFVWKGSRHAPSGWMERTYRDRHAVEISEVGADAAPVALLWRGARPLSRDYDGPPVPVEVRSHGGGLYEPIRHRPLHRAGEGHDYDILNTTPDQLVAATTDDVANGSAHAVLNLRTFFDEDFITSAWQVKLAPPKKGGFQRENRGERVERVEGIARGLLIVDGVLHAKVPEPVLMASPKDGAVYILAQESDVPYPERGRCYRLDEMDAAVRHVAEIGAVSPTDVARPDYALSRPEALGFAPEHIALMSTRHVMRETAAQAFRQLPLEGIEIYCDLTESRYDSAPADPETDARVLRLAEILIESCPGYAAPAHEARFVLGTRLAPEAAPAP